MSPKWLLACSKGQLLKKKRWSRRWGRPQTGQCPHWWGAIPQGVSTVAEPDVNKVHGAAPEAAKQWTRFRVQLGVQSGAKGEGFKDRAEDKAITWVQSLSRTQDPTQDWRKLQHMYEGFNQEAGPETKPETGTYDTAEARTLCLSWNEAGGHMGRGGVNLQVRLVRAAEAYRCPQDPDINILIDAYLLA